MSGYHQSFYTQAIGQMPGEPAIGSHAMVPTGSYYGGGNEQLHYPNEAGSPQYSGYGGMGDVTSYDMFGQGLEQGEPDPSGGFNVPPPPPEPPPAEPPPTQAGINPALQTAYMLASTGGAIAGAYHGYKRNKSWGWAIGWSIFGSIFPFLAVPVAVAQGFGKRKVGR